MSIIIKDFPRPTLEQLQAWQGISAATAHEAHDRRGALDSAIKPLFPGAKVLGPALTVRSQPNDNLTLHAALKLARPGDVIVYDATGFTEHGLFGDVMASSAKGLKLGGLVVDGGVRDSEQIRDIGFPVFTRAVSMKGSVKHQLGDIGVPVSVGGVVVNPGDLIIGDADGVVAIPLDVIDAVLQASIAREEKETRFREALLQGKTTWDLLNLNETLKRAGIDLAL